MNNRELIVKTKKIIGEQSPIDYILQPGEHVKEYEHQAPEFAEILKSAKLESIRSEFEIWNKRALACQKEFRHWSSYANLSAFLTVVFTTLILAFNAIVNKDFMYYSQVVVVLTVLSIVFTAVAGGTLYRIKTGSLLQLWMSGRASAETLRVDYFNQIVQFKTNPDNTFLSLLKLEYFRRYQLDTELAYYTIRSRQNLSLANKTLSYSTWLLIGSTVAVAIGGFLGKLNSSLIAITSFGLIFQALSSKITTKSAFYQYGKNAESFERTRSILSRLRGRLDDIRELVALGDNNALIEYTSMINEQISLEHRLWIDSFNERITTIDTMVEEMKNKQNGK